MTRSMRCYIEIAVTVAYDVSTKIQSLFNAVCYAFEGGDESQRMITEYGTMCT